MGCVVAQLVGCDDGYGVVAIYQAFSLVGRYITGDVSLDCLTVDQQLDAVTIDSIGVSQGHLDGARCRIEPGVVIEVPNGLRSSSLNGEADWIRGVVPCVVANTDPEVVYTVIKFCLWLDGDHAISVVNGYIYITQAGDAIDSGSMPDPSSETATLTVGVRVVTVAPYSGSSESASNSEAIVSTPKVQVEDVALPKMSSM